MISAVLLAALVSQNPYLDQAKDDFVATQYEKCLERLKQAAHWKAEQSRDEKRDIELYGGLCSFYIGGKYETEAEEKFRTALRLDPGAELDRSVVSPRALEFFSKVKNRFLLELANSRKDPGMPDQDLTKEQLLQLNREFPKPAPKTPTIFERHPLPSAFGVGSALSLMLAVGLGVNAHNLEVQANGAKWEADFKQWAREARGNAVAANIAYGLAATAALVCVLTYFLEPKPQAEAKK